MATRTRPGVRIVVAAGAVAALAAACAREPQPEGLRYTSASYYFTVEADQLPPPARESIRYSVFVRDRETRQPIETGEGQIYSSNADGAQTWDALVKGPAVGMYHGSLNFVTSGQWAIAIRFRRDSSSRLEKVEWMQDVLAAREPGSP